MDVLIEVNGTVEVPDGMNPEMLADAFIDRIEEQGWYFGGGFQDGSPIRFGGTVYSLERDLTEGEVSGALESWFRELGWTARMRVSTILEAENITLRRARFEDWKPMYENVWRHESAAHYMNWDVTNSEEEARDRIERTIRYQENGGLSFLVCDSRTDTPIGFAGVMEIEPGVYDDTGGCLGPAYQRRGWGKQMLAALERFVFSRGAESFIVAHRRENLPSKKVILARYFRYTHSEPREGYILDFYVKRRCDMEVKLTYHGHACFTLEYEGCKAVIDPYAWGMVPGQPDLHLTANAVYCSHDHGDHNFVQAVTLTETTPLPWTVQEFVTPHDDCDGAKRGMNTVRIFDCGGIRVAHLGDIGCFPDDALAQALEGVDCMLIPVGGYYTIGCQTAYQIIRSANPKVAIPMHYRTDKTGFDEISHIDDFIKLYPFVKTCEGPFELEEDTGRQILIMK